MRGWRGRLGGAGGGHSRAGVYAAQGDALTAYAGKGRRLSDEELNGLIEEVGVRPGGESQ